MKKEFDKKKGIRFVLIVGFVLTVFLLPGCSSKVEKNPLNPDEPVSVTLWHYYSGHNKEKFDELVSEFNNSVGMEKGIVIDAKSQGDVEELKTAVIDAANNKIGAQPMPDIFAAYPDTAYRVDQLVGLVDIEKYFSKEEIQEYRQDFLYDGRFGEENKLKIVPVAKSTEILYLNKTFWDKFASENNVTLDNLSTWEGVVQTAKKYYEWSGGKAFLGVDSNSNYMLISAMQLGEEIYNYDGDTVKPNFKPKVAQKIWNNFYVPYIKGYFAKMGRFSSDDAKVGTTIAYTGSTAGATYFPNEVTLNEDEVYPIESVTLPYPYFKEGKAYAAQQGAGMSITKSDPAHEYAAAEFLKWFTDVKQNLEFAVSTAYLPVKIEALKEDKLLFYAEREDEPTAETITSSIRTTIKMLNNYNFYAYKPFDGSYEVRQLLENHLFTKVQNDLAILAEYEQDEAERAEKLEELLSNENFSSWYQGFITKVKMNFK